MRFVDGPRGRLAREWGEDLHPATRGLLLEFERWSTEEGLPSPVITMLGRTLKENADIYVAFWSRVVAAYHDGKDLSDADTRVALAKRGKSSAELRAEAEQRFSWHLVNCAADVRTRHYSEPDLARVELFFRERVMVPAEPGVEPECKPDYEFQVHDVAGPHLHIAFKSFDYRKKLDPRPALHRGSNAR